MRYESREHVGNVSGVGESSAYLTAAQLSGTLGNGTLGGIALSSDGKHAAIALTASNEIGVMDLAERAGMQRIKVGVAPFKVALDHDGTTAWVSNFGSAPKKGERSATTGTGEREDAVAIDNHGIALPGTVMRIDLRTGRTTDTLTAGLHPTALVWDERNLRLYVANGNSESITVIDTQEKRPVATWELQPFARPVHGIAPTALALAPDGERLYVTCGGINAVAILDTRTGLLQGLIPTAWYPSSISLNSSGTKIAVGTLLGVGSGTSIYPNALKYFRQELPDLEMGISRRYVHSYRGTIQVIDTPDDGQLAAYTEAVAENNRLPRGQSNSTELETFVPFKQIDHVVYIVKENRSYDQIFGDLGIGNGDPSLELYSEDVTPNHRALARQFVLLDNFYATGGNSGDGHQWVTQGDETDYAMWPAYGGRSYPFDGNDPLAYANGGFLWDSALEANRSFADFGEFIPWGQFPEVEKDPKKDASAYRLKLLQQWKEGEQFEEKFHVKSPIPPLDAHLVRDFPSYGGTVPDVVRARIFLHHLKEWEEAGAMPNLIFLQLPSDHTDGTAPKWNTPKADMADNDLALGQIVDGLSHSKFWPHMAIFVVEDDAQGGVDHVDGHRTVALAVSPYVQRSTIDSTMYSHPSVLKTIEMMLSLKNLSLFDLIANDMRNSFTEKPNFTPYTSITPKQSLFDLNPPVQALSGQARRDALASARMNWTAPDQAPAKHVLDILWRNARGYDKPVSKQHNAVFLPYAPLGIDDDGDDQPRQASYLKSRKSAKVSEERTLR
jgi:DNA-binding beta-propeller fold protein YncE